MRSDQRADQDAYADKHEEGEGHRRNGAPDYESGQGAKRQGENGISDGREALDVEGGPRTAVERSVQWRVPPDDEERERGGTYQDNSGEQSQFDYDPAEPSDALAPGKEVGPLLEFATEEWGCDKDA